MKRLIIILFIVGISIMIVYLLLFSYFSIVSTSEIGIYENDIKLTNNKVEIQGMILNSSKYFKGYRYYVKGDKLFVRVYTSYIIKPDSTKLGYISIDIKYDTSTINYIYLQGRNKADTKLIWERNWMIYTENWPEREL